MNRRDEYVERLKGQLDSWNTDIAKWEVKAAESRAGVRAEFDKRLEALRSQREQAIYQLRLLQAATGDAWMELIKGADDAWQRMRDAYDKASSHFHPN